MAGDIKEEEYEHASFSPDPYLLLAPDLDCHAACSLLLLDVYDYISDKIMEKIYPQIKDHDITHDAIKR